MKGRGDVDNKEGLHVYYDGPLNYKLDTALIEIIESFGYEFWASGTDLTTGERDLAFSKEK